MLKERTPVSGGLDADTFVREQAQWPSYQRPASEWTALELYEAHPKLFDLSQPYFIGQGPVCDLQTGELPPFSWEAPEREDLRQTPLHASHIELGARLAPFAGWEMPLWYSSVSEEHEAVRKAAGLFDVAHMGVIELAGEHATALLDLVCTNYVRKLRDGRSMYGYLLDPDGHVIDDVMIYRRHWDRYVVVVNASNAEKDLAWLQAVSQGEVMVDRECPLRKADCCVEVRDLKAASSGQDRLVDLALQGPASLNVLKALADSREVLRRLSHLRRTGFIECELGGISVIVARTGYTGESQGYELLVHPESAKALWQRILEIGQEAGVKPCGLAARDSLRIEAGLPLYGHELAGPRDIGPVAAGFAPYCKFHKPFFVGRQHCAAQLQEGEMTVVRFRLNRSGARAIHQEDPVFGRRGRHIGWVTSCALVGDVQIGLALINKRYDSRGAEIGIFALPSARRMPDPTDYTALELGDRVLLHETATILSRFPSREERKLWRQD
jgi:glycine hydroxymethyltransferase